MKKTAYLILAMFAIFAGCNSDSEDNTVLRNNYIDISDFSIYTGSPGGAVELQFNNLKKKELVTRYLGRIFDPKLYLATTLQFNGNKLTYIENAGSANGRQVVSEYAFKQDSLYIWNADTLKFVALVTQDNIYYRQKGLSRYPIKAESRDTVVAFNEVLSLEEILKKVGYDNAAQLVDPKDTIIWCNVLYPFN